MEQTGTKRTSFYKLVNLTENKLLRDTFHGLKSLLGQQKEDTTHIEKCPIDVFKSWRNQVGLQSKSGFRQGNPKT